MCTRTAPARSTTTWRRRNGLTWLTVALLVGSGAAALTGCQPESSNDPNDPNSVIDPNDPNTAPNPNDPNDPNDPNSPDPNTCTVQFVNESPYDATVTYYIGTADQRFEPTLLNDPSRRHTASVPAREKVIMAPVSCPDVKSIKLSEVRFDLGGGASAAGDGALYLQGEDYECEDTLRFIFNYRIHSNQFDITLVVPPDCNKNRIPDDEDIAAGTVPDCNGNGIPDGCEIAAGTAVDANGDGIPDECQQQ
jgi:hypothetical protein